MHSYASQLARPKWYPGSEATLGVQQHPYNIPMPYNLQGPSGTQNLSYTKTSHSEHQFIPTVPQISSRSEIADSQPANQPPTAGPMLAVCSQSGNYLPSSAVTQNSLKNFEDVVLKIKNYVLRHQLVHCVKYSPKKYFW